MTGEEDAKRSYFSKKTESHRDVEGKGGVGELSCGERGKGIRESACMAGLEGGEGRWATDSEVQKKRLQRDIGF